MKTLEVQITAEDRAACKPYADLYDCILGTAIRRTFPGVKLCVGGNDVDMKRRRGKAFCYRFSGDDATKIGEAYHEGFVPFTVVLTPLAPTDDYFVEKLR